MISSLALASTSPVVLSTMLVASARPTMVVVRHGDLLDAAFDQLADVLAP